jgi:hypothetical protein
MKAAIIPVSPDKWKSKEMVVVVQQAKDSARKIHKGIDVRLERKRFSNACDRIEEIALNQGGSDFLELKDDIAQLLLNNLPRDGEAQFPFLEPSNINEIFKNESLKRLRGKIPLNSALVVILEPLAEGKLSLLARHMEKKKNIKPPEPDYSVCDINTKEISDESKRFHAQIRMAIETGMPLGWIDIGGEGGGAGNIGLVRHEALITAIREYIYVKEQPTETVMVTTSKEVVDEEATKKRDSKAWSKISSLIFGSKSPITKIKEVKEPLIKTLPIVPINIQFAYNDGSIGEKFPLYCLAPITPPKGLPIIRAALISNRHFELDHDIDICLIRNSEIERHEDASIAEQEQLSYEIALHTLLSFLNKSNGLELHLYHTGLEPAVIGTYRAILEILGESDSKHRGRFLVVPKMFRGSERGFTDLKQWY